MSIIRAYAMPHPPLAVPAVGHGEENKIQKTLTALDKAAEEIAALSPETIIYITPHGTVYSDYFHISPGVKAKGDLARFQASETRFETEYDVELVEEITQLAEKSKFPAGHLGEKDAKLTMGLQCQCGLLTDVFRTIKLSEYHNQAWILRNTDNKRGR